MVPIRVASRAVRRACPAGRRSAWWIVVAGLVLTCDAPELVTSASQPSLELSITGVVVGVGDSAALISAVTVDGRAVDLPVLWQIGDSAIAVLDERGLVRGLTRGRTVVHAEMAPNAVTPQPVTATDSVWVVAAGVVGGQTGYTMTSVGDTLCVPFSAVDARGTVLAETPVQIQLLSDADSTVFLAPSGCIVSRSGGAAATLAATLDTIAVTFSVQVSPTAATIALTQPDTVVLGALGGTADLDVMAFDARNTPIVNPPVVWQVRDTSVATVTGTGRVTARRTGLTAVVATADGAADSLTVLVAPPGLSVVPGAIMRQVARGSRVLPTYPVVIDAGGGAIQWTAPSPSVSWLATSGTAGTTPDTLFVTLTPQSEDIGNYASDIVVTAAAAEGSPRTIPVSLTVVPCEVTSLPTDSIIAAQWSVEDCEHPDVPGRVARVYARTADTLSVFISGATGISVLVRSEAGDTLAQSGGCLARPAFRVCAEDVAVGAGAAEIIVSTGLADTGPYSVTVAKPRAPAAVAVLEQRNRGDQSPVAVGGLTTGRDVTFRGTVVDDDPHASVRLEVEVQPVGVAFTGAASAASPLEANGSVATVDVTGLAEDAGYHWQARAVDETGRAGPWSSFGGNAETASDFRVAIPTDPGVPAGLGQFTSDSTTAINLGATTPDATVIVAGIVSDADAGDVLRMDVEVQPLGTPFTGGAFSSSDAVGTGQTAYVEFPALSDDTSYHWQARACDQSARCSAWVSFGGNAESAADFAVGVPEDPTLSDAAQLQSDSSTVIGVGGSTAETTVVFRANLSDPDAGAQVRLEVEVQPVGAAFTGSPTASTGLLASGAVAHLEISGLSEDVDYHWQARVTDETGRSSAWASFGGNAETARDFRATISEAPGTPSSLGQHKGDSTTVISLAADTDESVMVASGLVTDADAGDLIRLQIEVQPVATPFTGNPTAFSDPVSSGQIAAVRVTGLSDDTQYHWQGRVLDQTGLASAWVSYGGNPETSPDFGVAIPEVPGIGSLAQLMSDSSTVIGVGDTTTETTVVFRGSITDPDAGAQVQLEVEVQPVGVAFTGSSTASTGLLPSGAVAHLEISGLSEDVDYHWQARSTDETGRSSAWASFGGNAETARDFRATISEAPGTPSSIEQQEGDSTTVIPLGADTDESVVVVSGLVSDGDAGDLIRLQIEVQTLGTPFTGNPTDSGDAVSSGQTAAVRVTSLSDDTQYHWQVRARDQTGLASAWVSYGGNPETSPDFGVAIPEAPSVASLAQLMSDSSTVISVGDTTTETTVVFRGTLTDPDAGAQVRLEVEIRPVGVAFTGTASGTTALGASGTVAYLAVTGLGEDVDYHWQARAVDASGLTSGWMSFGGNAESSDDLRVATPEDPAVPAALAQLMSDSSTTLAVGDTTAEAATVFRGVVTDPDAGDVLRLEVEVKAVGAVFTGTADGSSAPVSTGEPASVLIAGLGDDNAYRWQARTCDQVGRCSGWISFGGNAESVADFVVAVPEAPNVSGLNQLMSDSTTVIAVGDTIIESTAVFRGILSDADPGAQVRLEVEVLPVGNAFTGTPTGTTTLQASGTPGQVEVTGLSEDVAYHWQARAVDETGLPGAWASFGGNLESAADLWVAVDEDPNSPTGLTQRMGDSTTVVALGDTVSQATLVFGGVVSDPDGGDLLRIQVEVQPVGTPFAGTVSATSAEVVNGTLALVELTGLTDDLGYHWRARTLDGTGRLSAWASFGGNAEAEADFQVAVPSAPAVPSSPGQFESDSTSSVGVGDTVDDGVVVFRATVTDADPGDSLRLQIERQPIGTPFTGTATATAPEAVASGTQATVTIAGQADDRDYHWQVRTVDQTGRFSAWTSFGGNPESEADYRVAIPETPAPPTGLAQYEADGTTAIPTGGNSGGLVVVYKGVLTDNDPGDDLVLHVEARLVGVGFSGVPTTTGTVVTSGQVSAAGSLSLLLAPYHWRARTCDQTGRCSAWVSYGGNAESSPDFVGTAF